MVIPFVYFALDGVEKLPGARVGPGSLQRRE